MTRRSFTFAGSIALAGFAAGAGAIASGRRFYALQRLVPRQASPVAVLRAVAGVRLPETLAITRVLSAEQAGVMVLEAQAHSLSAESMREGLWELRTYRTNTPGLASHFSAAFSRAGICPVLRGITRADLTYLIPFENLAARDRAWTELNADPEWVRARPQFESYHFGLYRVV
ncbi:MAG: hypothetical protein JWO19_5370 [Bryobacterales bacterium]|nr:hypothetical protein [Bryobacterales bacterium]